jgi:hypothetical protein
VLPQTPHDDQLLQDFTRLRNPATGAESLFGTLRAEFAPGERTDVLHVAFCPPFAGTPNVEAEQAEGPDAVVRVTQALAHGARLEVRLASTATETSSVLIDFAASDRSNEAVR